jgi:predicted transcriptional regulator
LNTANVGGGVRGFGELEGAVMQHLWAADGGATVREVHEQMRKSRQIAYTTVLSTVHNLYRKGRLTREPEGTAHRYRPTASRAEYSASVMRDALSSGGDSEAILSHFVGQMSEEESQRLQELLRRHAGETRG